MQRSFFRLKNPFLGSLHSFRLCFYFQLLNSLDPFLMFEFYRILLFRVIQSYFIRSIFIIGSCFHNSIPLLYLLHLLLENICLEGNISFGFDHFIHDERELFFFKNYIILAQLSHIPLTNHQGFILYET